MANCVHMVSRRSCHICKQFPAAEPTPPAPPLCDCTSITFCTKAQGTLAPGFSCQLDAAPPRPATDEKIRLQCPTCGGSVYQWPDGDRIGFHETTCETENAAAGIPGEPAATEAQIEAEVLRQLQHKIDGAKAAENITSEDFNGLVR